MSQSYISSSIFPIVNLSRLSFLNLSRNHDLYSEIPVQMANLTSLSILDLSGCNLQGSIPYLPQIKELHVRKNYNFLPNLSRMFQHHWPKLRTLSISSTNVSGSIPVSISNAPSLVSFDAVGCSIQGSLPSSISNLSGLQSLDLSRNSITDNIPISICEMVSLQQLYLSRNNLTGSYQVASQQSIALVFFVFRETLLEALFH